MEDRFSLLEAKVYRLQDQAHQNHLELLQCFTNYKDEVDDEMHKVSLKLDRHDSYFSGMIKILGLGGALTSWLSIKEFFNK